MEKFKPGDCVTVKETGSILIVYCPDTSKKCHYLCGHLPIINAFTCSYHVDQLEFTTREDLEDNIRKDFNGDVFPVVKGEPDSAVSREMIRHRNHGISQPSPRNLNQQGGDKGMHTLSGVTHIINYNSDLSGKIRIYNKQTNTEMHVPGDMIVDLVLGQAMENMRLVAKTLTSLMDRTKGYQGFCGHCHDQPCSCHVPYLEDGRKLKLKDLIPYLDDDMKIDLYIGDTSVTGLIIESGFKSKLIEAQAYHEKTICSINIEDWNGIGIRTSPKLEILLND